MDEHIIVVALSKKSLNVLDTSRLVPFNNRLDLAWVYSCLTLTSNIPQKLNF